MDTRVLRGFQQDRSAVRAATVNSGSPNGGRRADLTIFAGIWTHSSHRQLLNTGPSGVSRRRWWRLWPEFRNQAQYLLEQFIRHRDFGHLEDDVAPMAHDLGTDLLEFLPQAGQRPLLDRLRQSVAQNAATGVGTG